MKISIVTGLLFMLFVSPCLAQPRKGSLMTTGSFSYNRDFGGGSLSGGINTIVDQTNFYVSAGGFFTSRFAMGLDMNVDYSFVDASSDITFGGPLRLAETITTIAPGIFARWSFPISGKFYAFLEPGYSVGFGDTKSTYYMPSVASSETEKNFTKQTIRLRAGINYFVTERFTFELTPGFISWSQNKPESGDAKSAFSGNVGLRNLTFGVVGFFGGKGE